MQEGVYRIKVSVKDGYDAVTTESDVEIDRVNSRVAGSAPAVAHTANPLVALYSVPPGPRGTVHVEFALLGPSPVWQSTNDLPSEPGKSTNFFVAGLLPQTTYEMRDVFSDGTTSAPLTFRTGNLPSNLTFPTFTVQQQPGPGSDLNQDLVYHIQALPVPFATDLQGNVVWYYDVQQSGLGMKNFFVGTLVPGGTVLGIGQDQYSVRNNRDVLREIDLAGNPVRETNLAAVNAQLAALGFETIYGFHHDVQRLPNGATVVPAFIERTIDINGTPTNYAADMIVVLDKNFQVSWAWDPFDHLDVHRGPFLPNPGEPPPSVPNLPAVEWLHTNAVSWSPEDQNLVVSMRYQDWVVKIDYANGRGDGHVVWRLGQGGDFTVNSTDPNPWFSHQHDAHYIDNSTLILFDNGNGRRASDPTADSRGQVWKLDERTMTATLVVNVDLGNYSPMFGEAERLSNGDYSFTSGRRARAPNLFGQTIEVRPDGSKAYVLQVNKPEYRSFRISSLYEGVSDQPAGSGREESSRPDDDSRDGPAGAQCRPVARNHRPTMAPVPQIALPMISGPRTT